LTGRGEEIRATFAQRKGRPFGSSERWQLGEKIREAGLPNLCKGPSDARRRTGGPKTG